MTTKVHLVKAMVFSSSQLWMWELDHKQSWVLKSWCFQTVVLEKSLESPLDSKEIKPVNPKGNQSWIFTGRTDVEAEATILWPPESKSQLIGKDAEAGKDWGQEEKGVTKDEIVGCHHRQWICIWANFRRQWRTGKASWLQSVGSQRVGHDWATEQQNNKVVYSELLIIYQGIDPISAHLGSGFTETCLHKAS